MKLWDKYPNWQHKQFAPILSARLDQRVVEWMANTGIDAINNAYIAEQSGDISRDSKFSQYVSGVGAYLASFINWDTLKYEDPETLRALGFRVWDDEAEGDALWLFPMWLACHIPTGFVGMDVDGKEHVWQGAEFEDCNARFGCIGFGLVSPRVFEQDAKNF